MSGASETRYSPRNLGFEELVGVLVAEHAVMRAGLRRDRDAANRRDFDDLSLGLQELDVVFKQHIADEEAQILRLLIDELGAN